MNKEHHPDNLIAKGMPEEFVEQSNKELAVINLAYDKIKQIRSKSWYLKSYQGLQLKVFIKK